MDNKTFQALDVDKAPDNKHALRQYFSSPELAAFIVSMLDYTKSNIHILDPGAGSGALFVACMKEICKMQKPPELLPCERLTVGTKRCRRALRVSQLNRGVLVRQAV